MAIKFLCEQYNTKVYTTIKQIDDKPWVEMITCND